MLRARSPCTMKKDSWLYSDSFLKRAFAIWGHYIVANLIIGAAIFVVMMLMMLIFGLTFASFAPHMDRDDPWGYDNGEIRFDGGIEIE